MAANNLAYLMIEHGESGSIALSLAQTARRGLPNIPNSADTLGWAYLHQGVYGAAIEMLKQATNGDPQNPTYHYHLGLAYEQVHDTALAKKQFQYTLQIDPNFSQADQVRKALSSAN
jgi:cellulose synthase operon protein C